MIIKHLQGNTYLLNNTQAVAEFIDLQNVDVACLQEVIVAENELDRLKELLENKGFHYKYAMHLFNSENKLKEGLAIASKYPIIDSMVLYHNPKQITHDDVFGKPLIGYDPNNFHPASRALTFGAFSTAILTVTLALPNNKYVKVINTHFPVSDFCVELSSMYEIAGKITSLVKYGQDMPMIFSGDLNIRTQSYSVELIETVLTCHTKDIDDTLAAHHKAKVRGAVSKLAVDHVFSKKLKHLETKTQEVEFSDHKMLVSEFEMGE